MKNKIKQYFSYIKRVQPITAYLHGYVCGCAVTLAVSVVAFLATQEVV